MTTTNPAPFLAIATDKGMSGWGKATGRASFVVYECRDEHERKLAFEYLESRPEMKHVRTSYEARQGDYSPRNAHVSRYDAGKVPSVRVYREALETEKARRAGIDAGILSGTVCRYCGCRVASKSANDAWRNPVGTRAQHASDCEWIGMVLPVVAS